MRRAVFDMDGVLIDSNDAIRDCYTAAGASPPDNVLAAEGTGWLAAQFGDRADAVRKVKDGLYLDALSDGRIPALPPLRVAQLLHAYGWSLSVTTAAPPGSAQLFAQYYVGTPRIFEVVIDSLRVADRMMWLSAAYGPNSRGVYVDDNDRASLLPAGWRFIHYTGQSDVELAAQIMDEE